ncbi:MAG: diaminopimelate epimerase [Rikenellaceae bacterium]
MENIEYILCHGSGNRFVMIDGVKSGFDLTKASELMLGIAKNIECDGLLILDREGKSDYAMRMYNTDGTSAAMCGNGMRCIARLADELYIHSEKFNLYSGGGLYPIERSEPLSEGVATYGVDISVSLTGEELPLANGEFIAKEIEELHPGMKFTLLNLGNPHVIAKVDEIDYELLSSLGERVKSLKEIFPNGVNVSFVKQEAENQIFVATYERGVGLTASCGTAMTASTTTMALMGCVAWGEVVQVRNRGGFVRCRPSRDGGKITTQLLGNATYIETGVITPDFKVVPQRECSDDMAAWERLISE